MEDLPIPAVACYIENSKVFNITMDSSGRDGKDGLPGKDGIGVPGKDGISFSFEDLTSEQKALLLQPATTQINNLWASITSLQQLFANTVLNNWFYLDENGNVGTNYNFYSTKEISAYGVGTNEGGGGTNFNRLDEWALYTSDKSGWVLSALLGKELHDRVLVLEAGGGGGGGSTVEWGTLTNGYRQLTVEGVTYALAQNMHTHLWADITDKPSTFAPSTHTHTWASIESKPNVITGTTASFTTELETKLNGIAAGAEVNVQSDWNATSGDAYILNKPTTLSGYEITDAYAKSQIDDFLALKLNVSTFNDLFEKVNIGTELSPVYAIKAKYNFYSVGEVSAFGAGSGGSGEISYSRLDDWLSYDSSKSGWVLSAFLGKDLDNRVSSLESGSSTTITETDPTVGNHIKAITATDITNWNSIVTYLDVLSKLSLVNGKLQISVDTYSTGELSAYGAGEGGSGSSYSRLDTWASYDVTKAGWVLSALLGNDLNTRVAFLESNALLASAYTATDVLTKLKTVDGSGSGLDADLLDGFHAGGVSGAYWSKIPVVGADGVMEVGAYLDFHEANTSTSDYDGRLSSVGTAAFWNGNRMWHAANSNLSTIDWAAKNITVATDIITNFKTWTHESSKSLKKFIDLFDIDSNGNLVVQRNLYSTGEITAYSSGTGVSGLTL